MKEINYHDPSYVMVGFHRFQCTPAISLFGSSVRHHSGINLTIKRAELVRDKQLSYENFYGRENLIEITLSPDQFAQLLTTMNVGDGVPATMDYFMGESYKYPDNIPTQSENFKEEINEQLSNAIDELNKAQEKAKALLNAAKPLNKEEKKNLLHQIESIKSWARSHLPFIIERASEAINKSVNEAKVEVDSFVASTILKTGLESLRENSPELMLEKKEESINPEIEKILKDIILSDKRIAEILRSEEEDVIDSHITGDRSEV